MKRLWITAFVSSIALASAVWAFPTEINYQGTLKKNGLPDTTQEKVTFQLTSADGNTPYSQSITFMVTPVNGLFSEKLDFQLLSGITWENITPYIKVSVNDQALSNPEKVSATVYAVIASSVVAGGVTTNAIADGAVTAAKLDSGVQNSIIPSGVIMAYGGPITPAILANGFLVMDLLNLGANIPIYLQR